MTKKKSTIANIFYNSFGSIFYYGCQWLTTVLIVHLAGIGDAGIYGTAMTFTAAFAIFALYNTRQFQVSDVRGEYTDRTYILSRVASIAIALAVCALALPFNHYKTETWQAVLLYMVFKCGEAVIDVFHGINQKNARMDFICYSYIMRGILMIASFCGIIYLTHNLVLAILGMAVTTYLVAFLYDYPVAHKFIHPSEKNDFQAVKRLMLMMIPLVIVSVTNNLSISLPRYFLEMFFDEKIMGYYSTVSTPAVILQVGAATIFVPLITPLASRLAANDKAGFMQIIKKVSVVLVLFMAATLIGSALLGKWFIILIFGQKMAPYTYLFVPIIFSTLMISVNACLFPICTVLREIKGQLYVGIGGAVSSLAASLIFVRWYEMIGVVISLVITLAIQMLIQIYLVWRAMKQWKGSKHG